MTTTTCVFCEKEVEVSTTVCPRCDGPILLYRHTDRLEVLEVVRNLLLKTSRQLREMDRVLEDVRLSDQHKHLKHAEIEILGEFAASLGILSIRFENITDVFQA